MTMNFQLIYESSNGDRWLIGRQVEEPRVFVRHEPNRASGGAPANFNLMEFLAQQQGPEHEALIHIIADLLAERYSDDH